MKLASSVENVLLHGNIVIGHCRDLGTIILLILIDGYKEKNVHLWKKKCR